MYGLGVRIASRLLLALVLASCGGSGSVANVDHGCGTSAQCGDEVCSGGHCVPCGPAAMCPAGRSCASGRCVGCKVATDCAAGEACLSTGLCGACATSAQCRAGEVCSGGQCGPCGATAACPAGLACKSGACAGCASAADCQDGQLCAGGRCGPCASAADCAPGQICAAGACSSCAVNADCPAGVACINGTCGGCSTNGDCPAGLACRAGVCGACASNTDCAAGLACVGGICGVCAASAECPDAGVCRSGACVLCATGADCGAGFACRSGACGACSGDADCDRGQRCESGKCRGCASDTECDGGLCRAGTCGGCRTDADCGGRVCVSGACVACSSAAPCLAGLVCRSGACAMCATGADCPSGRCTSGLCLGCSSGIDCAGGLGCVSGACVPCGTNADCAGGRVCLSVDGGATCAACSSSAQCDSGLVCAGGVCGVCATDAQCPGGELCQAGVCARCASTYDCHLELCDPQGLGCVACNDPRAVTAGLKCQSGTCLADGRCTSCATDADCGPTGSCVYGACSYPPPDGGTGDGGTPAACPATCPAGQVCLGTVCAPCSGPGQCPSGQVCDAAGASGVAGCRPGACDPTVGCSQEANACKWSGTAFACVVVGGETPLFPVSTPSFACQYGSANFNGVAEGPLTHHVYFVGCTPGDTSYKRSLLELDPVTGAVTSAALPPVGDLTPGALIAYATTTGTPEERVAVATGGGYYTGTLAVFHHTMSGPALLWHDDLSQPWQVALMAPSFGGLYLVGEFGEGYQNNAAVFALDANATAQPALISTPLTGKDPVRQDTAVVDGDTLVVRMSPGFSAPAAPAIYAYTLTASGWAAKWSFQVGYGNKNDQSVVFGYAPETPMVVYATGSGADQLLVNSCIPIYLSDGSTVNPTDCTNYGLWPISMVDGSWPLNSQWPTGDRYSVGGPVVTSSKGQIIIGCRNCVNLGADVIAYGKSSMTRLAWKWKAPPGAGIPEFNGSAARLFVLSDGEVLAAWKYGTFAIDPAQLDANGWAATSWFGLPPPSAYFAEQFTPGGQPLLDSQGRFFAVLDGAPFAGAPWGAVLGAPLGPDYGPGGTAWPMWAHDSAGQSRIGVAP